MFIPSLLAIVAESQRLLSMPEIFGSNPATCLCLQLIAFKRRKQTKREVEISPFLKHIVPTIYQHFLVTIQSVYIIFLEFPKRNKEGLKRKETIWDVFHFNPFRLNEQQPPWGRCYKTFLPSVLWQN